MTVATVAVVTGSKPEHIKALRATWRRSAEHKAAQIKRFVYAMAAVVSANVVGDIETHKNPLAHFTDLRTAWYYLIPFAYIAWKQVHPSMSASEADSAPGVTIVPEQVGLPVPAPDTTAEVSDPSVAASDTPGLDTAPTGDVSADGTPAPPDYVPEGDAAP